MKKEYSTFDVQHQFEEEIKPKLLQLKNLCAQYKIPYFATFCIKTNMQDSEYYSDGLFPLDCNVNLINDKMVKHVLVQNGFDVVSSNQTEEFDAEDFDF